MSLLESASAASRCRARAAACLQSPQDDVNANNDAVETEDAANANNNAVAPKDVADVRADADDPSGDESSTDTVSDRAAIISVDNLAAAIVNAMNARHPAPTPLD